ncbi:MAG: TIM barrel protein, partial [Verrucomicrobiae bacterium]|nr:TIM barrel protein [Verrucomicrobiae bacterium]
MGGVVDHVAAVISWGMRLGAHMPIAGGIWKALERAQRLGCEAVQLFVKNNIQWEGREPSAGDVARFVALRGTLTGVPVFGHAGYLINLASDNPVTRRRSIKSLVREMEIAAQLGLGFLVMHPGSHCGRDEKAGLRNIISGLEEVFEVTRRLPVKIALENTAGQGTAIGYSLD